MRTWLLKRTMGGPQRNTSDRLIPKANYVLLRTYTLSCSEDTTERRTYYGLLALRLGGGGLSGKRVILERDQS